MHPRNIACCVGLASVLAAAAPLFAVQDQTGTNRVAPATARRVHSKNQRAEEEGQRVFDQNCARCHNAPDGFPTSVTGTIVRHMQVRANLSRHDEEVLLHYFNP